MNRLAALVLLDFRLMSKVRKICLFVLPVLSFFIFFSRDFLYERMWVTAVFFLILVSSMVAQPFKVTQQDRLEMFFSTLPLTHGDVVKARYLLFICIQASFTLPPLFIKFLFFPDTERIYPYIIFIFLITSVFAAITYFFGFLAAHHVYIAISLYLGLNLIWRSSKCGWLDDACRDADNLLPQFLVESPVTSVAAGLLLLCLSCLLSHKFYRVKSSDRTIEAQHPQRRILKIY